MHSMQPFQELLHVRAELIIKSIPRYPGCVSANSRMLLHAKKGIAWGCLSLDMTLTVGKVRIRLISKLVSEWKSAIGHGVYFKSVRQSALFPPTMKCFVSWQMLEKHKFFLCSGEEMWPSTF